MYAAGVTCSDCHEPHGGKLRAEGNAVCARCHASATYETKAHLLHAPGSAGASCVACHMPTRTYMLIDPRHDHSLRVPRPDLAQYEVPNACNGCHADRDAAWAAGMIEQATDRRARVSELRRGAGGRSRRCARRVRGSRDAARRSDDPEHRPGDRARRAAALSEPSDAGPAHERGRDPTARAPCRARALESVRRRCARRSPISSPTIR
jgi:predicted CXXCH cytochrome family protein